MKIFILLFFIFQFNIQDNPINLKARLIEDFTRTPNCGTALIYEDYDFAVIQNNSIRQLKDTIIIRIYCPNDVLKEPLLKGSTYVLNIKELKSGGLLKYELIDIKNEL